VVIIEAAKEKIQKSNPDIQGDIPFSQSYLSEKPSSDKLNEALDSDGNEESGESFNIFV
jgi:hypothetical protein